MTYCGVVIPVHAETDNRVEQLHKCLRNLSAQKDFIAVVVDDDSTKDLHLEEISDSRIRSFRRTKPEYELRTASCALNAGFDSLLSGEVLTRSESIDTICYLHSDDLLPEGSIDKRKQGISASHPFSFSKFLIIDEDDSPISLYGLEPGPFSTFHPFPHHSSMWELNFFKQLQEYVKETYDQTALFDETIFCGEDRDVSISTFELLRKSGLGYNFLHDPCYHYRRQLDSITGNNPREILLSHSQYVDEKHGFTKLHLAYNHLTRDLPWSLGFYLPEQVKATIRPIRDKIKSRL